MYNVVEFDDEENGGGGISVIRKEWLTPQKLHCMWPPHKVMGKFKKCLIEGATPNDTWEIYSIKRIFYETDNLIKAREKAKKAEDVSEFSSDCNESSVRRRKKTRKIYDSDTDEKSDDCEIAYPTTPADSVGFTLESLTSRAIASKDSTSNTSRHFDVTLKPPSELSTSHDVLVRENSDGGSSVSTSSVSASNAIIARHLAKLEEGIKELQLNQKEILSRLRSGATATVIAQQALSLPEGVSLPCTKIEEINTIDVWLTVDENYMQFINHLSYVGGNKTSAIIRRILEKLFSNKLAEICNWSGKNGKHKLQDYHHLIKVVTEAVRRHKVAETATENEIKTVISNWFRFAKDRDGGRESRRRTLNPTSIQQ